MVVTCMKSTLISLCHPSDGLLTGRIWSPAEAAGLVATGGERTKTPTEVDAAG
jgi:hypothetical protein